MIGPSVSLSPLSSSSTGTCPFGLICQKSFPDLVFFSLLSTCSSSNGVPVSRNTICGEREHAPGAKYSFMTDLRSGPAIGAGQFQAVRYSKSVPRQQGTRRAALSNADKLRAVTWASVGPQVLATSP